MSVPNLLIPSAALPHFGLSSLTFGLQMDHLTVGFSAYCWIHPHGDDPDVSATLKRAEEIGCDQPGLSMSNASRAVSPNGFEKNPSKIALPRI